MCTFEGWLPLHAACKTGNVAATKQLLHFAYPPYCTDTYTDPSGKVNIAHMFNRYIIGQVTYRFAFDVNKADEEMRTPLFLAAQDGHVDVVKILLNFRLDAAMHSTQSNGAILYVHCAYTII